MTMTIKLLKKGIKINGRYFPAHYSTGTHDLNGNATIYLKDYAALPAEAYKALDVVNDTDASADYFEKDRIRIPIDHPLRARVEELSRGI